VHFLHFVVMIVFVQVGSCFQSMYVQANFGLLTKGMVCSILLILLLCSSCGSKMNKRGFHGALVTNPNDALIIFILPCKECAT
jgi:DMSO/TMAO reductase YedYZ heme-binding membrane subunit